MKKTDLLILAGIGVVVGYVLLNSAQCKGNCRTAAKYISQHSLGTFVTTLLTL